MKCGDKIYESKRDQEGVGRKQKSKT